MANLTSLVVLDVAHNKLTGSLPLHWASSPVLEYFCAEGNQLTGAVPVSNLASRFSGEAPEPQ